MNRKPIQSIESLGAIIKSNSSSFSMHLKKNQRVDFNLLSGSDSVFYLESGSVSLYRISDGMLTITQSHPSIIGLTQLRSSSIFHYFRCDSDCVIWAIKKSDVEKIYINNPESLRYAYDALSYFVLVYHERDLMIINSNSKNIVIQHLFHIWGLINEGEANVSVYKIILSRNKISRSYVHRIINELTVAGCITIERGKIVMLNETLLSQAMTQDP